MPFTQVMFIYDQSLFQAGDIMSQDYFSVI